MPRLSRLLPLALLAAVRVAAAQQPDTTAARAAIDDYRAACAADAGALWGRSLCGAFVVVEPATRRIAAGDTAGILPESIGLANTSVDWAGRRWAMAMLPLPADRFARVALLAHESFHRIQDSLGLAGADPANPQLDTRAGRQWLRLELRALAAALEALPDESRAGEHARDALLFRARRRALFPAADSLEPALEMQEGLAEYTGDRLAMTLTGDGPARVARAVRDFQATPSYVRAFAYGTGPALGLLLDRFAPTWRADVRTTRDPARLLAAALRWTAPTPGARLAADAEARAARYGLAEVAREETARDSARRARLADYRARLRDGATVILRQQSLGRSFDPTALAPFDSAWTIYPTGTFTAPWGKLVLSSGGALVADDWSAVVVEAPHPRAPTTTLGPSPITGPGWTLELSPGWTVRPLPGRPGGWEVVKR